MKIDDLVNILSGERVSPAVLHEFLTNYDQLVGSNQINTIGAFFAMQPDALPAIPQYDITIRWDTLILKALQNHQTKYITFFLEKYIEQYQRYGDIAGDFVIRKELDKMITLALNYANVEILKFFLTTQKNGKELLEEVVKNNLRNNSHYFGRFNTFLKKRQITADVNNNNMDITNNDWDKIFDWLISNLDGIKELGEKASKTKDRPPHGSSGLKHENNDGSYSNSGFNSKPTLSELTFEERLETAERRLKTAVAVSEFEEMQLAIDEIKELQMQSKQEFSNDIYDEFQIYATGVFKIALSRLLLLYSNDNGSTANFEKIIKQLLDSGASAPEENLKKILEHNPPFSEATWELLLANASNLSLPHAIIGNNQRAINILLKNGVSCDVTKVELALSHGNVDLAEYLIAHWKTHENTTPEDKSALQAIEEKISNAKKLGELRGLSAQHYLQLTYLSDDEDSRDEASRKLWQGMHDTEKLGSDFPKYGNYSPLKFDIDLFKKLLALTKLACVFENNTGAEKHAYKLTVLFGNYEDALAYLKRYEKEHPDSKQPLHDACLQISIPKQGLWDTQIWAELVKQYGFKIAKLLNFAPAIEEYLRYNPPFSPGDLEKRRLEYEKIYAKEFDDKKAADLKKNLQTRLSNTEIEEKLKHLREGYIKQKTDHAMSNLITKNLRPQTRDKLTPQKELAPRVRDPNNNNTKAIADDDKQTSTSTLEKITPIEARVDAELTKRDIRKMTYKDIAELASKIAYKRYDKNPEFARECIAAGLSERDFETCLDAYDHKKASDKLPDLVVDGKKLGKELENYYFCKLPSDDIRGFILGFYTNSCQSVGSNAEEVALHGMQSDTSGFYVIMKKTNPPRFDPKKDKIVAQSWAWLSRDNNLVFDSLELVTPSMGKEFLKFYRQAAEQAVGRVPKDSLSNTKTLEMQNDNPDQNKDEDKLIEKIEKHVEMATLGKGGATPKDLGLETATTPETFIGGDNPYGDSVEQWVLAKASDSGSKALDSDDDKPENDVFRMI